MADDALEIAILEAFLRDTDFSYLKDRTCSAIPDGALGRAQADHMLRWHGLYRAIRDEFPNLPFHEQTLNAIWADDFVWDTSFYAGPLRGGPEEARSGWYGGIPESIAAAFLGQQGHIDAVIVAGVMLSHGYDFFSADGRPLIDGYRYLLPAIASYASATSGILFEQLDLPPGWYDSDHYGPNGIRPSALTRVLNPQVSADQRRLWVDKQAPSIWDTRISDAAWLFDVGTVGAMLSFDLSFLTPSEIDDVSAENQTFLEALGDTSDFSEEELPIDQYFTAYLVATHTDRLIDDALNYPQADSDSTKALSHQHQWLAEWAHESWRDPHCWPPGPFQDAIMNAIEQGTPGWFRSDPGRALK